MRHTQVGCLLFFFFFFSTDNLADCGASGAGAGVLAGLPPLQLGGGPAVRGFGGSVGGGGVDPTVPPAVLPQPAPAQRVCAVRRPPGAAGVRGGVGGGFISVLVSSVFCF